MFKNYLRTVLRNVQRNKIFTLINVVGLSLGLAAFLTIMEYVRFETNFDSFNPNANQIYRLGMSANLGDGIVEVPFFGPPAAETIKLDFPEVVNSTRLYKGESSDYFVQYADLEIKEKAETRLYADASFFEFFSIKLLSGNKEEALNEPNSVVITEEMAQKYFGAEYSTKKVLGELIKIKGLPNLQITGISENVPKQCHFTYGLLISLNTLPNVNDNHWFSDAMFHYFQMAEGVNIEEFRKKLNAKSIGYVSSDIKDFLNQDAAEFFAKENTFFEFFLQPLKSIHLNSHYEVELSTNGDRTYVDAFRLVSFLVLAMAAINFMNLSTVASLNRYKEVGVRKVLGALKGQLILQFLLENSALTLISLFLAITIMQLGAPWINELIGMSIVPSYLQLFDSGMWLLLGAVALGVISSIYPALHFSSFSPSKALKGIQSKGKGGGVLRNVLIIFQFSISLLLIIGVVGIRKQISHLKSVDLGYAKDQVLIVNDVTELGDEAETFKNIMKQNSAVKAVAFSSFVPIGSEEYGMSGFQNPDSDSDLTVRSRNANIDINFIDIYGIEILVGRNFSEDFGNEQDKVLVNQKFIEAWGWSGEEALGKRIQRVGNKQISTIIGVVKNFQINSLKQEMSPFLFELNPDSQALAVKFEATGFNELIADTHTAWSSLTEKPFSYTTAEQMFESVFKEEQQASNLLRVFSVFSIIIGCLGLFGVASYLVVKRSKEVGIRKVLGASSFDIFFTLSKNYLSMVCISGIIAIPLAYHFLNDWLSEYTYRIDISLWLMLIPFFSVLLMTLFIVGTQVYKVVFKNPIVSLRYE